MKFDTMLVDGKNLVYRAVYASRSSKSNNDHPILVFMRALHSYKNNFKPSKINIFWDVKKDTLWRKKLYPEYKDSRNTSDVAEIVSTTSKMAVTFLNKMKCTQFIRNENEADDLIYAYVLAYKDKTHLIVSADGDVLQIPYHHEHAFVYNPNKKDFKVLDKPQYDPVIIKSLSGDSSDNIKNYPKVGDITAAKLIRDNKLDEYLNLKGRDLFDLNLKLVDLSKNPQLDDNINYIKSVKENDNFDYEQIRDLIKTYKVYDMNSELNRILSFKNM